jgi:hypothetical protein
MMKDMGVPHLHFDSYKAAKENVPIVFPEEIRRFAAEARGRIENAFDRVAEIAREQAVARNR